MFYIFDCEVTTGTTGAPLPRISELCAIWNSYFSAGKASTPIRKQTGHLIIGDLQIDPPNETATFLIRLSDLLAPNAVYSDVGRKTFKEHRKQASEGNDMGAHVLFSTAEERGFPNVYLAMVEAVPGLSYQEVRRLLNRILRYQYHDDPNPFMFDDINGKVKRDGTPVRHKHLPRLEFRGRPSANLEFDLKRGKIGGLTLIKAEQRTPVAGIPYLIKTSSELRLAIDHNNSAANLWDDIKHAMYSESRNYPAAKISFKLPNQPRTVSISLDSKTGAPLSEIYVQSIWIRGISPLLSNSSLKIVPHLTEIVADRLIKSRKV